MRIDKNTTIRLGDRNIVKIKIGDSVIWQKDNIDYLYIENTYAGSNTITFTTTQSGTPTSGTYATSVEYSKDKITWNTLTFNPSTPQTVTINTGEKLYLRNNFGVFNYVGSTNRYNTQITVSQSNIIGGNINTLLDYNNPDTVPLSHTCFYGLFKDNSATTDISRLKFGNNTLNTECYRDLFRNCTSITTTPELPNTNLAEGCYYSSFQGCTSLTEAPQLPAKTLVTNCYRGIFRNCKSLNNVTVYADDISASNCTSNWLNGVASTGTFNNYGSATYTTGVSGIPTGWTVNNYGTDYLYIENTYAGSNTITFTTTQSGTPASGTYATSVEYSKDKITWTTLSLTPGVNNTISLNQGEKLYFRNNSGYFNYTDDSNNYYTSITGSKSHKLGGNINTLINYTDLSNVSLSQGCFNRMFLNDIELVDASDLKLPSTTLSPHCYRALLNNCQSLLYAPALPATTLANRCYYAMFNGDKSLTTAPELPATTLVERCYDSIFKNCTSLTSVTIYATSTANGSFGAWLSNVAASGTVYNNGGISLPKNSTNGIPTGWTEVKK